MGFPDGTIRCMVGRSKDEAQVRAVQLFDEVGPLMQGLDPPSERINPDYKQQPSNPRRCEQCNKVHDCIIENTMTGERIEELKMCKDCIMEGWF